MKTFDSTELRAELRNNVPPPMRQAYEKVVNAGLKFMFDKRTHQYMLGILSADGEMDDKLASGIDQLMGILMQNSKGAFPAQLILPAGIELMMHAADYVAQSGQEPISPQVLGSAIQRLVFSIAEKANIKPDMLMAGVDQIAQMDAQSRQQGAPRRGA